MWSKSEKRRRIKMSESCVTQKAKGRWAAESLDTTDAQTQTMVSAKATVVSSARHLTFY